MKTCQIIAVNDVTPIFRDKAYDHIERGLKGLKIGNMYTYACLMEWEGKFIPYLTQSGDEINNYSIDFLN